MLDLRQVLLTIAAEYREAVARHSGRSLARVSTIVLNQGGFFRQLEEGKGCTVGSFEAMMRWFADPVHWPLETIAPRAEAVIRALQAVPVEAE